MDYRRDRVAGATYFFTVTTFERRPILVESGKPECLKSAIARAKTLRPFHLDAFVLMPDHLHCMFTLPSGDDDFPVRWMLIKSLFSRLCSKDAEAATPSRQKKRERAIWQRRYWEHRIRNELDFERHCDYIHYNPVKHGYVERVVDWPYSTFARFVKAGVYPPDWGGNPGRTTVPNAGE